MRQDDVNRQTILPLQRTLPNNSNPPARCPERLLVSRVDFAVAFDLCAPEFLMRGGPLEQVAVMPMPEAAVNEQHGSVFGKYEIRFARQTPVVEPKAETASMQPLSQDQLGLRVLSLYAGHHPASGFR